MEKHPVPATRIHFPEEDVRTLEGALREILRTGQLTLGKRNSMFEHEFAAFLGVPHAIAVNSGTGALEIILRALHLVDADVVVPTNTFAATAFAVVHSGNRLLLADVGEDLCMSGESLAAALTPRTRAVILVHIGGLVAKDTLEIAEMCRERGIFLIEDAAHAHGSSLRGQYAGTFGAAAAFSFYPTKVMTSGEGGMIATGDSGLDKIARVLRDQGKAGFTANTHVEMGYNWRMSEIHAALGSAQLRRLGEFIKARRAVARLYDSGLSGFKWLRALHPAEGVVSNYYKYIAFLDASIERKKLKSLLREKFGVSMAGEVYDTPLHRQPIFKLQASAQEGDFPVAEELCQRHVCLPMSAVMTEADVRQVVHGLREVEQWL